MTVDLGKLVDITWRVAKSWSVSASGVAPNQNEKRKRETYKRRQKNGQCIGRSVGPRNDIATNVLPEAKRVITSTRDSQSYGQIEGTTY